MRNGFTLLEVVLALILLQVGVLSLAGTFLLAQRSLARAELTLRGLVEAEWIGDSLAAGGGSGTGSVRFPWGHVSWSPSPNVPGGWDLASVAASTGDTLVVLTGLPALGGAPLGDTCGLGGPVRVKVP